MPGKKFIRRFSSSISDLLNMQKEENEFLPLHQSVCAGNVTLVKNLIDSKVVMINQPNSLGKTALHLSIDCPDTEVTSVLLKLGADVNYVDIYGSSPCHYACQNGMIDHFNLLFYYHADIFLVNKSGKTPFDMACEFGHEKMAENILNSGVQKETLRHASIDHTASSLHLAAKNGHIKIVSLLLKNNWDINYSTIDGSALHMAVSSGHVDLVRFLLKRGIDVSITNVNGLTARKCIKKSSERNTPKYKEIRFLLKNFQKFINATAITDYNGFTSEDLSFSKGDQIWITHTSDSSRWAGILFGEKGHSRSGFFSPSTVQKQEKIQKSDCKHDSLGSSSIDLDVSGRSHSFIRSTHEKIPGHQYQNTEKSYSPLKNIKNSKMHASLSCLISSKFSNGNFSRRPSVNRVDTNYESSSNTQSFLTTPKSNISDCGSNSAIFESSVSICNQDSSGPSNCNRVDVLDMIRKRIPTSEILICWLESLQLNQYVDLFLDQGYDLETIEKCTPADLLALGIKNPNDRKIISNDIRRWNFPEDRYKVAQNTSLRLWLPHINIPEYEQLFEQQNYFNVGDIAHLTWEDFEDIGIKKLGHLKKLEISIKKIQNKNIPMPIEKPTEALSLKSFDKLTSPVKTRDNDFPPRNSDLNKQKIYCKSANNIGLHNFHTSPDNFLDSDVPIRLNLVQAGKILNNISKRKSESSKEFLELSNETECQHCKSLPQLIFKSNNTFCSCNIFKSSRNSDDVPESLPPLLMDDCTSENSSRSSSPLRSIEDDILNEHSNFRYIN